MSAALAYYRLPHADHYTVVTQQRGEPEQLPSYASLNGREGFVVAPFAISSACPLLLIRPDKVDSVPLPTDETAPTAIPIGKEKADTTHPDSSYHIDFSNFHAHLTDGDFHKIVLSRCKQEQTGAALAPESLFLHACRLYPRMFVALVSAPACGTWLMATPELLLEGHDGLFQTIALAGTMRLRGDQLAFDSPPGAPTAKDGDMAWSLKNMEEQRYVATYVMECLEHFSTDIRQEGPYTVRAGNLVHLRSDFRFTLPTSQRLGDLLQALHPTPAVCGLPKRESLNFILHNEHTPRQYYSGFMGPLHPDGDSHLYVSLRCMRIDGNRYALYAGGGLLRDSVEQQEWDETEAKLETMKSLIYV